MSRFVRLALVLAVVLPFRAILPQERPLSITAEVRTPEFKVGSEVYVWVSIKNVSDRDVVYTDRTQECDYGIEVHSSISGLRLPLLRSVQERCATLGGLSRRIRVTIKPGEARRDRIELDDVVDLSTIGGYSVQISRRFPGVTGEASVSNEVHFQIVP